MSFREGWVTCALLILACGVAVAVQQREGSGTAQNVDAMTKRMEAATPGEHHKHLGKTVALTLPAGFVVKSGSRTAALRKRSAPLFENPTHS